jgi:DnaJ-class molecular chaperone
VKRKLSVRIPAGVQSRAGGAGAGRGRTAAAGAQPGRAGHSRRSARRAALGAEVQTPLLDGETTLTIPRGTQHGAVFRVSGGGLPNLRSGRRGDLVVAVKIEVPTKLTEKQEQLVRALAETEDLDVLPERRGFLTKLKDLLGN